MENLKKEGLQAPESIHLVVGDPFMGPFAPGSQLSFDDHPRLRFWEIEGFFKCPVVGWCFDVAEQKEVLRKEGISIKGKSNLQIHEILVKSLDDENRLSRRIDFWLNRKYQKEINELSSLEQGEFIKHWEASLERDEIDGILWVAVTRADLPIEARMTIFGDLHMETHERAKQIDNERKRLDQERKRNESLAESAKEASRMNKILKRENEGLRNELAIACRLSDTLQRQTQELEKELSKGNENSLIVSLQKENAQLRAEREGILKQISVCQGEMRTLENQNNKLLSKLKKLEQIRLQRSNESGSLVKQISDSSQHDPASSIDLSKRCVLVVGGLPKMEALYRRLIERNKGIFEYHDGRMSTGPKELVNQVRRADLVLCCIDHSSHTSALVVKKLCKKYKKPFRMLINSSLNNIFLTLLAFQSRLTTIQNGQEDSYDTPSKTRSGGEVS
jgi:hypothetical protein